MQRKVCCFKHIDDAPLEPTLFHGDVVSAVIALKAQPGPDLQIIGEVTRINWFQARLTIQ